MEIVKYRKQILPPTATIRRAMEVMTGPGVGIVIVTGARERLVGVVVDSDLRKAMLRGCGLDTPISKVMNRKPFSLPYGLSAEKIAESFRKDPKASVPLVDSQKRVKGLVQMAHYLAAPTERPNWVVLLVGGAGKRLGPLTKNRPKPLLTVGNKPILETILDRLVESGFKNFIFAINYKADQIKRHFGDGSRFKAHIEYIQEKKPLGTAGPLSLIKRRFKHPVVVMNGDLLTKIDFASLIGFHEEEGHLATLCVREYDFQVPFGVVEIQDHKLKAIVEKPTHRSFINAGIYVLDPKVISRVPKGRFYNMPELLDKIRRSKRQSVGCFPIREYWVDIGQREDLDRAMNDYDLHF